VSYETAVDVKGEKHLLEVTKVQLRNSENEVIGLIGISQNITTRRQQEDELKLANLVYQHSSEAMMLTDHENKIIAINPAFTEITGYSEHELIGRDPNILSSGKQSRKFYKDLWDELKLTGSWSGEIRNTRKNGSELVEWLSISTIYDERGEVYRRVGLFSDITEQKRNAEIILKQANYDSLTQLPNRSMFNDRLEQEIKKSQRSNLPLALIFLDLDHFKEVNDTQGHESGDLLLIEAANRLKSCVRESDTVARLGGDEFTIILPALTEPHDVEIICEKILKSLVQPFDIKDKRLYISASLGVTIYPDDGTTILDLLKNADQAMYLSKQSGRNRFRYFTPHMQQEAYRRQSLLQDLRNAIPLKQLEVYYQPIIDLESNQIHKAEALLRWKHPERGMVSPAEFIPLAEDSGLIVEIGDWIFKEVVNQVRRCQLVCQRDIQISVNKSPIQFRETKDHLDWIDYLRQHGLSGEHIAIEITEGLLMDDDDTILAQLHQFRDHNIEVAMDDFGTGYSSLSYLKKFDIDYLKIDQAFTRGIAPGTDDLALCQAIIVMAHTLGLNVIAEGIETEDQLQLLIDSGCDYAQGYYFSKPLPADDFIDLLDNSQKIDDLISKISREY
jgi:diguanylate cyclase (GGDEF)-like protein/PAS domain S-box-containing protein